MKCLQMKNIAALLNSLKQFLFIITIIFLFNGYRTGVKWAGDALDPSETSLQKYINDQTNNKLENWKKITAC